MVEAPVSNRWRTVLTRRLPRRSLQTLALPPVSIGELEIARYGVAARSAGRVSRPLALLAQSAERAPMLYGLLAQALPPVPPVVLLTSDGCALPRSGTTPVPLSRSVGAHGACICGSAWRSCAPLNPWGTEASTRPLIVVDGLDSWLEAPVRQPDTENLLYDLLAQVPSRLFGGVHLALNPAVVFAAGAFHSVEPLLP